MRPWLRPEDSSGWGRKRQILLPKRPGSASKDIGGKPAIEVSGKEKAALIAWALPAKPRPIMRPWPRPEDSSGWDRKRRTLTPRPSGSAGRSTGGRPLTVRSKSETTALAAPERCNLAVPVCPKHPPITMPWQRKEALPG